MIKFAVTRPPVRKAGIERNVAQLGWDADPYLREFGLRIDRTMAITKAKLLPTTDVQYGNGKVAPGYSGRWDLRGKKFISPNVVPLRSWAIVSVDNCVDKSTLENFAKVFLQTYRGHGGRIEAQPRILGFPSGMDQSKVVKAAMQTCCQYFKSQPQIIFFVLRDKSQYPYERFKKNMDCRYAMVSQMMNAAHVKKAQPQYCSNVCMKVNSKLGGQTSRIPSAGTGSPFFTRPTMMIGMDVSHASPGGPQPSIAALTVSMDKDAARYAAAVQTNGYRIEVVMPTNLRTLLPDLLKKWIQTMGCAPEHVFYFRDGLSEGEFAPLMIYEVNEIRKIFQEFANTTPKITVIVATKRHHVRFFPKPGDSSTGDKNGNPLPGTVVEREVTHPFHYDFYLCSHVAIQGTARPVHYHVVHDEVKMKPEDLQKMIYQQSYQYARSTTPVSLHPAVYYAHLAGCRAHAHENKHATDQDPNRERPQLMLGKHEDTNSMKRGTEALPLLPMGSDDAAEVHKNFIKYTMWYI